jgi:hypothetical protein
VPFDAFYRDLGGGRYESSPATAGPWSPRQQHAGPPSALIGRAMERCGDRTELRVARVTIDLPRPVPVGEIEVAVRVVRSGARSELLEGEITADGQLVMLARAWRVVRSPEDTPTLRHVPEPPPLPGEQPPHGITGAYLDGYISAIEWRFRPGESFDDLGPGRAWGRQRIPLVAGEPDTPLTRALTIADASWAVGFELDRWRQFVINTDVTLALHRDPVGEWLCMRTTTVASPGGSGLAYGQLDDAAGDCGRILQTLLIASR